MHWCIHQQHGAGVVKHPQEWEVDSKLNSWKQDGNKRADGIVKLCKKAGKRHCAQGNSGEQEMKHV